MKEKPQTPLRNYNTQSKPSSRQIKARNNLKMISSRNRNNYTTSLEDQLQVITSEEVEATMVHQDNFESMTSIKNFVEGRKSAEKINIMKSSEGSADEDTKPVYTNELAPLPKPMHIKPHSTKNIGQNK